MQDREGPAGVMLPARVVVGTYIGRLHTYVVVKDLESVPCLSIL